MAAANPPSVMLTHAFRGRVFWEMSHWLIRDNADGVILGLVPGATGVRPLVTRENLVESLASAWWETEPTVWRTTRVLRITPAGAAHSIDLWWEAATNRFLYWHINLQEPLRRTARGIESWDQLLDISVAPDRTWRWKDEDELAEAVARGMYSAEEAAVIREEGERVSKRLPELVPTGWEDWMPDPDWSLPQA